MVYSKETAAQLAAIAKGGNISVEQLEKLIEVDKKQSGHDLPTIIGYMKAHPDALSGGIDDYNAKNATAPIVPGQAQKRKVALVVIIAVVVLALSAVGYFKFIKKRS